MSEQQHRRQHQSGTGKQSAPDDEATATEVDTERASTLNDDVDSILDEIDEVLEENAEEFVRSFVQKGGE